MLIQRTVKAAEPRPSSSIGNGRPNGSAINVIVAGWTLLVPAGWGNAFWHSLAYADARVGGLRERGQMSFEAGTSHFPEDWPGTTAYNQEAKTKATELQQKWDRKPPSKRVNFDKMQTLSPWKADFTAACDAGKKWSPVAPTDAAARDGLSSGSGRDKNKADRPVQAQVQRPVRPPTAGIDTVASASKSETESNQPCANVTMDLKAPEAGALIAATTKANGAPTLSLTAKKQAVEVKSPNKQAQWLLQGSLLSKLLDRLSSQPALVCVYPDILSHDLRALVSHARAKRGLHALPKSAGKQMALISSGDLAGTALVKIALKPIRRGSPKYNAMIYLLSSAQLEKVKERIVEQRDHQKSTRTRSTRAGKSKETIDVDDERDSEEEAESDDEADEDSVGPPYLGIEEASPDLGLICFMRPSRSRRQTELSVT